MRYFVIRCFGKKTDSAGRTFDFDRVERELIAPALERCGFEGGTTNEITDSGSIHDDMYSLLLQADLVIADITVHNPNVFYELGVRHALRRKRTVLIKADDSADRTPFDLGDFRYLPYRSRLPSDAVPRLVAAIQRGRANEREGDSPVFRALRALPEAPADAAVPRDFLDELRRAKAARDRGWLAMLADELRNLAFERAALRLVASAQHGVQDFDAARVSLERLRNLGETDPQVYFQLANVYDRLFRSTGSIQFADQAEAAVDEALQLPDLSLTDQAEALALRGRNRKSRWRRSWEGIADPAGRRAAACRRSLFEVWLAYRESFERDLNSFYSGLACLQTAYVLLSLAKEEAWEEIFGSKREAAQQHDELAAVLPRLRQVVVAAIARARIHADEVGRGWARISEVDLSFLAEDGEARADASALLHDYEEALRGLEPFHRDAVIGQLQLFASLGVRSHTATGVIAGLRREEQPAAPLPHLVLFAGHQIDSDGRTPLRFPAAAESEARRLIREQFERLRQEHGRLLVLASGANGADILAHEVCGELGIATVLCLPMPIPGFAVHAFGNLDRWRNRFRVIAGKHREPVRVLQDSPELPRWLHDSGTDVWQRGIRWIVGSARNWNSQDRTLLAFWDGNEDDRSTGGVAEVVRQVRASGMFAIEVIDSRQLCTAAA